MRKDLWDTNSRVEETVRPKGPRLEAVCFITRTRNPAIKCRLSWVLFSGQGKRLGHSVEVNGEPQLLEEWAGGHREAAAGRQLGRRRVSDRGADVRVRERTYPEWPLCLGPWVGSEVITKLGQAGACGLEPGVLRIHTARAWVHRQEGPSALW